jgi:hypothetical protein
MTEIDAEAKRLAEEWAKTVDQKDVAALKAQGSNVVQRVAPFARWLKQHPEVELLCPDIEELCEIALKDLTDFKKSANLYGKYIALKGGFTSDVLERYPLIDTYAYGNERRFKHWVVYINAICDLDTSDEADATNDEE